jgi:hypothetical protein
MPHLKCKRKLTAITEHPNPCLLTPQPSQHKALPPPTVALGKSNRRRRNRCLRRWHGARGTIAELPSVAGLVASRHRSREYHARCDCALGDRVDFGFSRGVSSLPL